MNKVRESRFIMVRDRQVNQFNRLPNKINNWDRSNNSTQSASNDNQAQATYSTNNGNNQSESGNSTNKWVVNLSKTSLTPAHEFLLSKGPNFAIAPNNPPNVDFITAIESVCHTFLDQDSQELRAETSCLLKKATAPRANITREENKALRELREDKERIVLTVDKGVPMVLLDKKEYLEKAEALLMQEAYRTTDKDPTNKLKARLIQTLRRIKKDTNMGKGMCRIMYPTSCTAPKFYGLPKIHNTGTPLRPTVSSRGSVTYGMAKVLTRVLKPLVGKLPHHIQSTRDFVNRVREVTLLHGDYLYSYYVSALFTSVPIDPALNINKDLLEQDDTCMTGLYCQYRTLLNFLGSVCTIYTSLSKINFMNRLKSGHWVTIQPYSCQPVHGAIWKGSP